MFKISTLLVCLYVYSVSLQKVFSQTCCTAGMPVSSIMDMSVDSKSLSFQLSHEYRSINLLVDNNTVLKNDPRSRSGQNTALKVAYGFNSSWAVSVVLPVIQQSRSTISETQNSFGLGDLLLLTKYSHKNLSLTSGLKIPTGSTQQLGSSAFLLSPDMQSGSGSYDAIFRLAYNLLDLKLPFLTGNLYTSYRLNGTNDNFASTTNFQGRRFGFGNEFISGIKLDYTLVGKLGFIIPQIGLQFRHTRPNIEQQVQAPNSGGSWINMSAGLGFSIDGQKTISIFSEIPIYQKLKGLQITSDFSIGLQLSYNLLISKK